MSSIVLYSKIGCYNCTIMAEFPSSKLSTSVQYKKVPATLLWSNGGKIELYSRDATNSPDTRQLLQSIAITDIKSVKASYFQYLSIRTSNGTVFVTMPGANRSDYTSGYGAAPIIVSKEELARWNRQPLTLWRNAFKEAGVPTRSIMVRLLTLKEFLLFFPIAFIVAIVLMVATFGIYLVFQVLGNL